MVDGKCLCCETYKPVPNLNLITTKTNSSVVPDPFTKESAGFKKYAILYLEENGERPVDVKRPLVLCDGCFEHVQTCYGMDEPTEEQLNKDSDYTLA